MQGDISNLDKEVAFMRRELMGDKGAVYVTGTSAVAINANAIYFCTNTTIAAISSNWTGTSLATTAWVAGQTLYGRFTSITLTSGTVAAYNI